MRARSADGQKPAWRWYALAGCILLLLVALDVIGAASPFAPG
ncbi:MAG: hypothetical protein OEM67_10630 [Thermoleophilia bacterium]|nr:hypothetical protein [Thermoleophilia bacterium]